MKKFIAVLLVLLLSVALFTACKESDETHNSDSTGAESMRSDTTVTVNDSETTADSAQSTEESMNGDEFINDNEATYNDAWN